MRLLVVPLLVIALAGSTAAFLMPWNIPSGTAEADDGDHLWGTNRFDDSTFVYAMDAAPLRQIGFPLAVGAVVFVALALAFAIGDRRGGSLSFLWLAFFALAAAGTLLMVDVVTQDVPRLGPGLFVAGASLATLFLAGVFGVGLGKAEREAYLSAVYG